MSREAALPSALRALGRANLPSAQVLLALRRVHLPWVQVQAALLALQQVWPSRLSHIQPS